MKKRYTQEEINEMSEKKMMHLFEQGKIDDDQVQRWYDNQEEMEYLAQQFIDDEYQPSACNGDYSPSSPWNAPGMSIKDFI